MRHSASVVLVIAISVCQTYDVAGSEARMFLPWSCRSMCVSGHHESPCENTFNGVPGGYWEGAYSSWPYSHQLGCNGGLSQTEPTIWLEYGLADLAFTLRSIVVNWQDPCKIVEVQFTFSDGSSQTFSPTDGCMPDAPASFSLAAVTTSSINMTFTMAASATTWQHARVHSFTLNATYTQPSTATITHSILELSTSDLDTSTSLDFGITASVGLERGDSIVLTLPHFQGTAQPTALVPEPLPKLLGPNSLSEVDAVDGVVSGDMVRSSDPARSFVWVPPESSAANGVVTFRIWTPMNNEDLTFTMVGMSQDADTDEVQLGIDGSYDVNWKDRRRRGYHSSTVITEIGSHSAQWATDTASIQAMEVPGEHTLQVNWAMVDHRKHI